MYLCVVPWFSAESVLNRVSGSLLFSRALDRGLLSSKMTYPTQEKKNYQVLLEMYEGSFKSRGATIHLNNDLIHVIICGCSYD